MEKTILGKSNISTAKIGFGGIPIQRVSKEQAVETIRFAIEQGITFFDSARAYSVSEEYIGQGIKGFDRNSLTLATKAPALTAVDLVKEVEISLKNFDTSYIDLFQIHNVKANEEIDKIFGQGGSYEAFVDQRNLGRVLHFGLTAHKREVLDYAISKFADKIETIMFPFNIVESQGEDLLKKAKTHNIGTIIMKPLGGGNFEDTKLALRFVLQSHFADIAIPGMGNILEIGENVNVESTPLTSAEFAKCKEIVEALGNDFCRRCSYCAPCPQGIDIAGVFSMATYMYNYDLKDWAKARYLAMTKNGKDCTKCKTCMPRCPYELDIIGKMETLHNDFLK